MLRYGKPVCASVVSSVRKPVASSLQRRVHKAGADFPALQDRYTELISPFKLERFFSKYEFSATYLLCCSDCQPVSLQEVLQLAPPHTRTLWDNLTFAYTQSQGLPELRDEISSLYQNVPASAIVVLVPEEGIFLSMLALLGPGDHVVVTAPGYQSLYEVARWRGAHVSFWEAQENEDGFLRFDTQDLREVMRPDTRLVVVNFPHNPTGCNLSDSEWNDVIGSCREVGAHLFSDEMYLHLPHDGQTPTSAADRYERAIVLNGMSKSFGLPGIRIGWLVIRDEALLQAVVQLKDYTTICSSAPSEVLALMALQARDVLVAKNLELIGSNLELLQLFFERHSPTLQWQQPQAGPITFPALTTGEDVEGWCQRVVEGSGVLLLPATAYSHAPSIGQGRFRMGFGRADMPQCLEVLDHFLTTHPSRMDPPHRAITPPRQ